MGKTNTKAAPEQVSQEMTAAQIAEQEQAALDAAAQEQAAQEQAAQEEAALQSPIQPPAAVEETTADAAVSTATTEEPVVLETDLVIQPVTVTPPPPVAVQNTTVVEASKPVAANASVTEQLATILKDVPAPYQLDISRVQAYIERMSPKRPVDSKVGVAEQVALYRAIQNIINRQELHFTQLFSALLFLFKVEGLSGALSDRYRMRFMDNITLHVGDRKAFANITQMLHILADPKSRQLAMGQINMERALENGLTAEGRKRVLDYFGV